MTPVPFISPELSGIGGQIKAEPAHFVVEEIPLYDASGQGQHVYVRLSREGWTTHALRQQLTELFQLRQVDVGYAGLKDKHARATQTFSLLLPNWDEAAVADAIQKEMPVEVEWVRRHRNKLKTGHLLGNRFRIVLLDPEPGALPQARAIIEALQARGLPNFYGSQRFGVSGENAQKGRHILQGGRGPRQRWRRRFLLSAYQSELFNTWLTRRIERGWFERLLTGDLAKKLDTGGMFEVEEAEVERPRFERREITYTGPIYGYRMRWPGGQPGELERQILAKAEVTSEQLRRARLKGSRRPARIFVDDLRVEPHPEGLLFNFSLPKGSYATVVLREFIKADTNLETDDEA